MTLFADEVVIPPFVTTLGQLAGIVVTVVYFLRHISEQNAVNRKSQEDVVSRVDAIMDRVDAMESANRDATRQTATEFTAAVTEFRQEHRRTVDGLIAVHKESGATIGAIAGRVGDLGTQVTGLAQQVAAQGVKVDSLADKVETLADRVEHKG